VCDPEGAELMACRQAVILAKEMGSSKLVLETDCLGAVTKLRGIDLDRSGHGPLVEEIKALLEEFEDFSVIHVRRLCNEVAHRLAKEGCRNKLGATWHGTLLGFVMNLVNSDVDV
jgi:ribonuclease HI